MTDPAPLNRRVDRASPVRWLRKAAGIAGIAVYLLVVVVLALNTWSEYAHGAHSLGHAVWRTVLLVGLPFFIVVALTLPEAAFHLLAWLGRKLSGRQPPP